MNHSKLKINFLLAIATFLSVECSANDIKDNKNNSQYENIKKSFISYLQSPETYKNFSFDKQISVNEIESSKEMVWKAWKDANKEFDEEKLIPLVELKKKASGTWTIPNNLEAGVTMPYYWGSKGTKPEAGFPLFMYIHGSGPKAGEWQTGWMLGMTFDDSPSVYFIPQIPSENSYRWYQKSKQYAFEKTIRQAYVSGNIDANRFYILGISEGGYGSQRLASFYADYLAGAGPMAGGEPLKNAPVENCRHIAFSFLTGAEDNGFYRNTLTKYTMDAFDEMEKQHPGEYIHRIELIPGRQHSIDYKPTTPWLKKYIRNPYPKTVSWEDFDVDGNYRKGFYNLEVLERTNNNGGRTYYQMDIKDNNINITVDDVTYTTIEKDPRYGIEMKFQRSYKPTTTGKFKIYLSPELVDLQKEITITVNGRKAFSGKVKTNIEDMITSCATYGDPYRLYPASVIIDLGELK